MEVPLPHVFLALPAINATFPGQNAYAITHITIMEEAVFVSPVIIAAQAALMALPALLATLPISDTQLTQLLYAFARIDITTLGLKPAAVAILPASNAQQAPLPAAQAATHSLSALFREVAAYV